MSGLQINVLTAGDAHDIKTWSSVPYFVSNTLESRGVRVNRVNVIPMDSRVYRCYRRYYELESRLIRKVFGRHRVYDFYRDRVSIFLTNRKIRRELRRSPPADYNLFLTFSFSSCRFSKIPVLYYCDQTYELYLRDSNQPVRHKQRVIFRLERRNLECAAHVFTTSRHSCEFIRGTYGLENVDTVTGGINLESCQVPDAQAVLEAKLSKRRILFIGKGYHKRGVDILLQAFARFADRQQGDWTLHIIGFSSAELGGVPENVIAHGMLDKGKPHELELYLDLLQSARIFVMPMREGPLPGVLREAALMYTPAAVTDIWNVSDLVQNGISGLLVAQPDAQQFAAAMLELVADEQRWKEMALRAHESADRFGWGNTVDKMLSILQAD